MTTFLMSLTELGHFFFILIIYYFHSGLWKKTLMITSQQLITF